MEIGSTKAPSLAEHRPPSFPERSSVRTVGPGGNSSIHFANKTFEKTGVVVAQDADCGESTARRGWRVVWTLNPERLQGT
jgi:hypothetical protein